MKKQIISESNIIKFTFEGLPDVTFHADKCSDVIRKYATMHGFAARIGDNAAIPRKSADGSIITVTEAMRRDAVLELVNHYESGVENWELKAKARVEPINPFYTKLAEMRGCTYAEAQAWHNAKLIEEMQAIVDAGK